MPGLDGANMIYDRSLRASVEETFGTVHSSPSWTPLPILGDGFKLGLTVQWFRPETNLGGYRRKVSIPNQQEIGGAHTVLAYPSVVDFYMAAALSRDADGDLDSYTLDYYNPQDPRRFLGCVINSLALRVEGTGDGAVQFEADWWAKLVERAGTLESDTVDYGSLEDVPFMFRDASLKIEGSAVTDVTEFTLSVENNLSRGPYADPGGGKVLGAASWLFPGGRDITLELTKVNLNDILQTAMRYGDEITFEASFVHPETGALFQFSLPMLQPESVDESVSRDEPTMENTTLTAVTDDSDNDIYWGYDSSPTTTLAAMTTNAPGTTSG